MRRCLMVLILLLCFISFAGFSRTKDKETGSIPEENLFKDLLSVTTEKENAASYEINGLSRVFAAMLYFLDEYRTENLTPMEALDKVKGIYAAGFDKEYMEEASQNYYYKLPDMEYYLVYEGSNEDGNGYLIHLYEFVLDEPETGIGHTVTYGWFTVDKGTGDMNILIY